MRGMSCDMNKPNERVNLPLQVNKMALDERSEDGDPLKFVIRSNDPARDELRIVCQAEDEPSKKQWTGILRKQLQRHLDFIKALQAPIDFHRKAAQQDS